MEMIPPLDAARRQAEQSDESEQQAVAVRGRQNELAPRPQHAAQLPRGEGRIDEVFQDFAAPDQVEGSVRKGQRLVRIDHLTLVVEALHVDRRDDVPASLEPTTLVSFPAPYVERPPPRPGRNEVQRHLFPLRRGAPGTLSQIERQVLFHPLQQRHFFP